MNVEPPETLVIIESIVYKSNGFAIREFIMRHLGLTPPLILVGKVETKIVLNLPYFPHLFYTKSAI
jgi:hypothetical protein